MSSPEKEENTQSPEVESKPDRSEHPQRSIDLLSAEMDVMLKQVEDMAKKINEAPLSSNDKADEEETKGQDDSTLKEEITDASLENMNNLDEIRVDATPSDNTNEQPPTEAI